MHIPSDHRRSPHDKMYSLRAVVFLLLLCIIPLGASENCTVENNTATCEGIIDVEDTKIEKIILEGTVEYFGKENFTKYENLRSIDLSNIGLNEIEHDTFISNENLEELNLSQNENLRVFISSKSLKYLNLSQTAIEIIPENLVDDLPNLEIIDLTNTPVMIFSPLSKLQNLKTLIISEKENFSINVICDETKLQKIIEIQNDKRITHNCTHTPEVLKTVEQTTVNETIDITEKPDFSEETTIIENTETEIVSETYIPEETTTPIVPPANIQSTDDALPPIPPEINTEISSDRKLDRLQSPENQTKVSKNLENGITEINKNVLEAEAVQPSPSQSSGVNIVLGIILCVMIVGALGFGYKYWKKNRQGYRNANTEDVEIGKELQDMSTRPICHEDQN